MFFLITQSVIKAKLIEKLILETKKNVKSFVNIKKIIIFAL